MKILGVLAVVFLAVVVSLSLMTALTSASASLANGVANAAASTALLTAQCLSGWACSRHRSNRAGAWPGSKSTSATLMY
jgi:hypothetical protein